MLYKIYLAFDGVQWKLWLGLDIAFIILWPFTGLYKYIFFICTSQKYSNRE